MNKVLIIFGIILLSFSFITCDNDSGTKTCACPNGTLHLVGETCCSNSDCTCEKDVAGQRVQGIAVTNRDNVAGFNAIVTEVTNALDYYKNNEAAKYNFFVNNLKEIRVVTGPFVNLPSVSQGVLTVEDGASAMDISAGLEDWAIANGVN